MVLRCVKIYMRCITKTNLKRGLQTATPTANGNRPQEGQTK